MRTHATTMRSAGGRPVPLAGLLALLALLVALALPATGLGASITAHVGGDRAGSNGITEFTSGGSPVTFEYRPASGGSWADLCTVPAGQQSCSSDGPANNTTYVVRVKDASQGAAWRVLRTISYNGGNAEAGPSLAYESEVRTGSSASNVTASPNRDRDGGTTDEGLTRYHMLARTNPALPQACSAFNVVMSMDRSGSINSQAKREGLAAGAKALVDGLAGSAVTLRIDTFNSTVTQGTTLYQMSSAADRQAAKTAIDNLYSTNGQNYTNWDEALQTANNRSDTEIVVFLTDGNPTRTGANTQSTTVRQQHISYAIASANSVKAAGKRVIAVGAGQGVTEINLAAISGPVPADDYFTGDFDEMEQQLKAIAAQICGAKVNVRKFVDRAPGTPAADWTFTATAQNANDDLTITGTNNGTTIGAPAETVFSIGGLPATGSRGITVDEVMKADHDFGNAACRQGSYPSYGDVAGLGQSTKAQPIQISKDQEWYCTYVNLRHTGSLEVVKDLNPSGDPGRFNLSAQGPTPLTASDVGDGGTTGAGGTTVLTGTYAVSETAVAGTDLADYEATTVCYDRDDQQRTPVNEGGTVDVGRGDDVVCVITNTRGTATVTVTKVVQGAGQGDTAAFPMTLTGQPGFALGDGDSETFTVPSHREATLAEGDLPAGYDFASIACEIDGDPTGEATGPSITFTPATGQTVECTITNTKLPTLTVTKVLTGEGAEGDATRFPFTLTGREDFTLAGGESDTGILAPGEYAVAEGDLPTGYAFTGASCVRNEETIATGRSMDVALGAGDAVVCVFTNERETTPEPPVDPPVEPPVTPPVTPPAVTPDPAPEAPVEAAGTPVVNQLPPALAITKAGPARARGLQRITYTIRVRNTGTVAANRVVVTDRLPRNLTFVRASVSGRLVSGVVRFQLGTMRPGQVRVIRVVALATADARGRRVNVAQVRATGVSPRTARAATVFTPIQREVAPAVTG